MKAGLRLALGALPLALPAGQARAETPAAPPADAIVVTGHAGRVAGQVDVSQAPVVTLDEADIASYGAATMADLMAAIAPQTGSGRGRGGGMPVILVNGLRISSFREMRDYPPEAIRKVEVLPEEVALRYGYPPDTRVVNLVLKDNFRSRQAEVEASGPDRGGTRTLQGHAGLLRIKGPQRLNATIRADHTSLLTEADRGVVEPAPALPAGGLGQVAGDPLPADNRSLVARQRDLSGNLAWTRGLGEKGAGGSLTLNATASHGESLALAGLDSVLLVAPGGAAALRQLPGALTRSTTTDTVQGGAALNRFIGSWQLAATLDAGHVVSETASRNHADTSSLAAAALAGTLDLYAPLPAVVPGAVRVSRSAADNAGALVTLIGRPLRLPAGPASLTLKAGFAFTGLAARDSLGLAPASDLRRGDASAGMTLALPLTSRREQVGAALGDITLQASLGANRLSDFGWLVDWSAGLTWSPTPKLGLQASWIGNQAAPGLGDLGAPQVASLNVPLFDFASGRTVLATVLSGGNPALARQQQHDLKLLANWQLPIPGNSNLLVEYFDNRSSNVTIPFPLLTPAVEAAYPGRVTRAGGVIVLVDQRPVTLASQHQARLRWGLNLGGNLGKPLPPGGRGMFGSGGFGGGGGAPRPGGPGGGARGGMGGGMGGGFPGGGPRGPRYPGRWNLSLYHTVQFVDLAHLAPGSAALDLLNGDALAGGGVARHSFEGEGGFFYSGVGLRLSGTWASPTRVSGAGSTLNFGSVLKLNLRGFVELGQLPGATRAPLLKGARLGLMANNLLNRRQRVTDASGQVPLAYQPDLIDPLGRVLGLELRKLF